jgi:WD40 repeat protein
LFISLFAKDIKPFKEIKFDSVVKDMVVNQEKLIVGTDTGKMQVYNIKQEKIVDTVQLPKIKDFMGDVIDTRVASVDFTDGKYLLLSDSGIGGYTNIWIYENKNLKKIISHEKKLSIVKARFIDTNHILFGFLSNEVALYDIKDKKMLYIKQLSESKFSDFALNEDKTLGAFSCESGIIYIVDTKTGEVKKELKSEHVDNVYKVDFKNGKVSGAGQDRRASLYDISSGKGEHVEGNFLIYATGLSPKAQFSAYALDEQNNIHVFNTLTKSKVAVLKGQKSTLNTIVFADKNTIFSASEDDTVMMWKLNK